MMEQISDIPEGSIIYLNTDTRHYFAVIVEVVRHYTTNRGMEGVYVTSTRPAPAIIDQMQVENIPVKNLYFVDAVSYLVGNLRRENPKTAFVESPTMLETLMLKTDFFIKRLQTDDTFALFDSMSGLSIYNDEKMIQEFIHILTNTMRMKDISTILLTVREQTSTGIDSMLRLNCDDTVEVGTKKALRPADAVGVDAGGGRSDIPSGSGRDMGEIVGFGKDDLSDDGGAFDTLDGGE